MNWPDWMPGEEPQPGWPDEKLVDACLRGNEAAWEALLAKYKRLIYSVPFRYGAQADDAGDIFQAVCLDLYHELPRLRNAGSLRSWLLTVSARQSLKWKKRCQRYEAVEDIGEKEDEQAPLGRDEMASLERAQLVSQAMEELTERCRLLLQRLFFNDPPQPYEEVARELGLATGSIGFTRGRCLEKLRKALEGLGL